MKTYCKPKQVDIESACFNSPAVHKAFSHGKLAKNEFANLLTATGLVNRAEVEIEYLTQNFEKVPPAIEAVCEQLTQRIRERNLHLRPIRQFLRADGLNKKMRTLSKETAEQQAYEYIAVAALMPLFNAKLLPIQYGSIPGRGQTSGKRKIERILRRKFHSRIEEIKGDVKHAYESVTVECVMRLLRRDVGKNKPLLWFLEALMANYPNGALVIGGYLPTWLFNYVMSYVLRYLLSLEKSRRGIRQKLVLACVCYADDFSIYGHISNLRKAIKKTAKWCGETLGLSIKRAWNVNYIGSFEEEKEVHRQRREGSHKRTPGVDMMGYVVYRTYTIIRGGIYVRLRRQLIRAGRELAATGRIPVWRAYRIFAYYGWLQHSNSVGVKRRYNAYRIIKAAKKAVSRHSKSKNLIREAYINERKLYAGA